VMTWEDLEKAREEHAIKEAKKAEKEAKKAARQAKKVANTTLQAEATAEKVKRGRKRKSSASGADGREQDGPEPSVKIVRTTKTQVECEGYRAEEAKMY
jgi:hypothetical protein